MFKDVKKETLCLLLTVVLITAWFLTIRFIDNSQQALWTDETVSALFVANQSPLTRPFWQALKAQVAGMPWSFIEYWAYLEVLKKIPFEHLMKNLELYIRLPIMAYSLITIVAAFLMIRRLSKSLLVASFVTTFIFVINYLSAYLSGILRFHTVGFAYSTLSWCLLAFFCTSTGAPRKKQYALLFFWVMFVIINGWSHIYSVYSLLLQWGVYCLVGLGWVPRLSLPPVSQWMKRLALFAVGLFGVLQVFFFFHYMSVPGYRGGKPPSVPVTPIEAFVKTIAPFNDLVLLPGIWFWVIALLLLIIFALKNNNLPRGEKWKMYLIFLLSVSQLLVGFVYGTRMELLNWPATASYTLIGIVPFVFFLSYLAEFSVKAQWDEKPIAYLISLFLIGYCLISPRAVPTLYRISPQLNLPIQPRPPVDLRWHDMREQLLKLNAYGKVNYIFGAVPTKDHSWQKDVHGRDIDHTWQVYSGGPFSVASITQYTHNLYGGRTGLSCSDRNEYPIAQNQPAAQEYAVDFCEEGKVFVRVVKK